MNNLKERSIMQGTIRNKLYCFWWFSLQKSFRTKRPKMYTIEKHHTFPFRFHGKAVTQTCPQCWGKVSHQQHWQTERKNTIAIYRAANKDMRLNKRHCSNYCPEGFSFESATQFLKPAWMHTNHGYEGRIGRLSCRSWPKIIPIKWWWQWWGGNKKAKTLWFWKFSF